MNQPSNPIAKLWELFIGAILLLALLPMAIHVVLALVFDALRSLGLSLGVVLPHGLAGLITALVLSLIVTGTCARLARGRRLDARTTRERHAEKRAVRQSVRRSAVEVPLADDRMIVDSDPALNDSCETEDE